MKSKCKFSYPHSIFFRGRKRRHQKKSKKTNKPNTTTAAKVTKKRNNGESSKSKKTDRKSKKGSTKLVEVSLDPPSLIAKLTLPGCKGGRNEPAQRALDFWKFVDAYTSVITAEDMNVSIVAAAATGT